MQKKSNDAPYGAFAPFAIGYLHAAHCNSEALRLHRRKTTYLMNAPLLFLKAVLLAFSWYISIYQPLKHKMAELYFYKVDGQESGPVSGSEINELANQGTLKPTDFIRAESGGEDEWHLAGKIEDTVQERVTETISSEPIPEETSEPEIAKSIEEPQTEEKPDIAVVLEKLEALTSELTFNNKLGEKRQEQIDKLYDENQEYKQGILEKFKKSLVLEVIGQIDAAFKTISHFGNQEFSEENYCKLLENYSEIATDFQDSLAQSFDVAAFNSEKNTPFDAKRQRALKTVPTEDETKHKTIGKSLRSGYEITNADGTKTLLRLEMVEVYVHQSLQSSSTP